MPHGSDREIPVGQGYAGKAAGGSGCELEEADAGIAVDDEIVRPRANDGQVVGDEQFAAGQADGAVGGEGDGVAGDGIQDGIAQGSRAGIGQRGDDVGGGQPEEELVAAQADAGAVGGDQLEMIRRVLGQAGDEIGNSERDIGRGQNVRRAEAAVTDGSAVLEIRRRHPAIGKHRAVEHGTGRGEAARRESAGNRQSDGRVENPVGAIRRSRTVNGDQLKMVGGAGRQAGQEVGHGKRDVCRVQIVGQGVAPVVGREAVLEIEGGRAIARIHRAVERGVGRGDAAGRKRDNGGDYHAGVERLIRADGDTRAVAGHQLEMIGRGQREASDEVCDRQRRIGGDQEISGAETPVIRGDAELEPCDGGEAIGADRAVECGFGRGDAAGGQRGGDWHWLVQQQVIGAERAGGEGEDTHFVQTTVELFIGRILRIRRHAKNPGGSHRCRRAGTGSHAVHIERRRAAIPHEREMRPCAGSGRA